MFESSVDILADFVEKSLSYPRAAAFSCLHPESTITDWSRSVWVEGIFGVVTLVNRYGNDIAPVIDCIVREGEYVPTHGQHVCNKPRLAVSSKNRSMGGLCIFAP